MTTETLNLVLSGFLGSQALVLMTSALRARGQSPAVWPVVGVAIGFFFYAWTPLAESSEWLSALQVTMFFEAQIPVLFWILCESFFRDDFHWRRSHLFALLGPLASLVHITALGIEGPFARQTQTAAIEVVKAIHLVCIALGLRETLRDWSAELVNSRRTVRIAVLGLSGAGLLVMIFSGFYEVDARTLSSGPLTFVNLYVFCTLFGANAFLIAHPDLLGPGPKPRQLQIWERDDPFSTGTSPTIDSQEPPSNGESAETDEKTLGKLRELLDGNAVHTQEGLTLAQLAIQLRVPTYRLRQVINASLGFRNFNQFLAHHRIAHAKRLLNDPQWQHEKIISIAFEVGYASLAPFNKSFKDMTGLTPSDYRKQTSGAIQSNESEQSL